MYNPSLYPPSKSILAAVLSPEQHAQVSAACYSMLNRRYFTLVHNVCLCAQPRDELGTPVSCSVGGFDGTNHAEFMCYSARNHYGN